jgi:hypothetical protein
VRLWRKTVKESEELVVLFADAEVENADAEVEAVDVLPEILREESNSLLNSEPNLNSKLLTDQLVDVQDAEEDAQDAEDHSVDAEVENADAEVETVDVLPEILREESNSLLNSEPNLNSKLLTDQLVDVQDAEEDAQDAEDHSVDAEVENADAEVETVDVLPEILREESNSLLNSEPNLNSKLLTDQLVDAQDAEDH